MHPRIRSILAIAILAGLGAPRIAADEPGVGSTRDEIIACYGPPRAVLSAGAREILTYGNGRVILENGRVTRLDLPPPPRAAAAAPAARPQTAARPPAPARPAAASEPWLTDFSSAEAEAGASKRRILALFTGSDWCPGCIRFEEEVAHNPEFLATTRIPFVLLKLDYPRATPQPDAVRKENEALRKRYGISAFPTLLILNADGSAGARVDTSAPRRADDLADFFVQAVDEARRKKPEERKGWWPF